VTVVRMWEASVLPGRLDDAVAWLVATVVPDALEAGADTAETFRAIGEERAVLITRWPAPTRWTEPAPPEPLWTRAHAWAFEPAT
jgi:hypothetical protein